MVSALAGSAQFCRRWTAKERLPDNRLLVACSCLLVKVSGNFRIAPTGIGAYGGLVVSQEARCFANKVVVPVILELSFLATVLAYTLTPRSHGWLNYPVMYTSDSDAVSLAIRDLEAIFGRVGPLWITS